MHKEHLAMGDRYAKRTGKHRDTKRAYVLGTNVFSTDVMYFGELRTLLGVKQPRTTELVTEHGIERVYKGKRAVGIRRKDAKAFGIES